MYRYRADFTRKTKYTALDTNCLRGSLYIKMPDQFHSNDTERF